MLITQEDVDNLLTNYRDLLLSSSKKMNLVSRRNVDKTIDSLLADSLLPLQHNLSALPSPVIDIGTGGGLPGLPLKIQKPELQLTLVDANRKKCAFLKMVVRHLSLTETEVLNERAESLVTDPQHHHRFGTLISRGVGNLQDLLDWGRILVKPGGEMLLWKGSHFRDELTQCSLDGWREPQITPFASGLLIVRLEKSTD